MRSSLTKRSKYRRGWKRPKPLSMNTKAQRLLHRSPGMKPIHRRKERPPVLIPGNVQHEQYNHGYAFGYAEGLRNGQEQFGSIIEGTSIIIPTFNKAGLLKECVASIQAHTLVPHEIIIVDNASTDETAEYLLSMTGKLRFHINEINRGFAGAVNTGLMMAKGQTICMLNNDTLVTPNWLSNMLTCLRSNPGIGIVSPVTNYISGTQQITVPYRSIEHMWKFAAEHNRSNANRWEYTDRIVGFCFLFTRDFFESVGYMDEGYQFGNFEDEDYIIRARLNGRKLVVARDTFIHHHGSQSMRELGEQFHEINERNAAFYSAKWGNPHDWINRVGIRSIGVDGEHAVHYNVQHYYPSHVAVTGLSETIYWIEHGTKYPLRGHVHIPITRLAQVDLLGYTTGPVLDAAYVERKWHEQKAGDGSIPDGAVFQTETSRRYQRQGDVCREFMSSHALQTWHMDQRLMQRSEQERAALGEGLPIMAAPVLHSYHI